MRGDEDCRNVYAVADEMLLKLQAIHVRHLEIDNQAFGRPSGNAARNSCPDPKVCARKACERSNRLKALSTAGSSSTTAIHGEASAMKDHCGACVTCRVGPWANRFVFPYFEDSSFSAIRTRSAMVRMPSFSIIRLR